LGKLRGMVKSTTPDIYRWAVERLIEGDPESKNAKIRLRPERRHCIHHHSNKSNFVGLSSTSTYPETKPENEATKDGKTWQWFPSWNALSTHYFHELGFLAGLCQLTGATIFSLAGITALRPSTVPTGGRSSLTDDSSLHPGAHRSDHPEYHIVRLPLLDLSREIAC
jgi:hypothetical protein